MDVTTTRVTFIILGLALIFPTQTDSTNDFLQYNNSGPLPEIAVLYKDYCPGNSLCTTNQSGTTANGQGCCSSCSCSFGCFQEGNCCPDVLQYANETVYETCVRPQYLEFGVTNSSTRVSFYMTHRCMPEFKDTELITKCEIIPRNPRNFEDFLYTLPVTKANSTLVYRNMYCGLCNGEAEKDLVRWNIELVCNSRSDIQMASFDELLYVLNRDKICNLVFYNPLGLNFIPRRCSWGHFTQCNQTGNMDSYNKTLDAMCGAFTAMYARYYRNVFCFMCNVPGNVDCPDIGDLGSFDIMSFTAILDFNAISYSVPRPPEWNTKRCATSQQYDSYKDVCRNITCARGSIYIDGVCQRQYATERHKSYDVYLRLFPSTEQLVCVNMSGNFSAQLKASFYAMLATTSQLRTDICSFVKLFHPGKNRCEHDLLSVEYVLFHIEIYSSQVHSVDQYLTELSSLDDKLIVVGSHSFRIRLDSGYYGEIDIGSIASLRRYTDPKSKEVLLELSPFSRQFPSFLNAVQTCPLPVRHMRVTRMSYCRRVFLPSDEYRVNSDQELVCLETIDLCLSNGTYEQTQDGLEMCADVYFAHVQNLTQSNSSTYACNDIALDGFSLVSIVCTTVSMFCLILTVLTYILLKSLRTTPGKNNMFLSINLLIAQGLFQFGAGQRTLGLGCVVIGALTHYFWLSAIVWMNICSFHMFRVFSSLKAKTMSSKREGNRDLVAYVTYSVLAPLVIVGLNILISLMTSEWSHVGYGGCVCYISSNHMILYTFAIPVAFLLSLNLIFFVIVIISIRRSQDSKLSSNQNQITTVVYLKLSCLTGASWIFGFLFMSKHLDVFGYIFIVLTTGEGIFIFLSFICSKRVLKMYRGLLEYYRPIESKYSSRTTMSSVSNVETKQTIQDNCQQTRM